MSVVSTYIVVAPELSDTLVCPHLIKHALRVFLSKHYILRTRCWQSIPNLFSLVSFLSLNSPLLVSQMACGLEHEFLLNCLALQQGKQSSEVLMFSSAFSLLLQNNKQVFPQLTANRRSLDSNTHKIKMFSQGSEILTIQAQPCSPDVHSLI